MEACFHSMMDSLKHSMGFVCIIDDEMEICNAIDGNGIWFELDG